MILFSVCIVFINNRKAKYLKMNQLKDGVSKHPLLAIPALDCNKFSNITEPEMALQYAHELIYDKLGCHLSRVYVDRGEDTPRNLGNEQVYLMACNDYARAILLRQKALASNKKRDTKIDFVVYAKYEAQLHENAAILAGADEALKKVAAEIGDGFHNLALSLIGKQGLTPRLANILTYEYNIMVQEFQRLYKGVKLKSI